MSVYFYYLPWNYLYQQKLPNIFFLTLIGVFSHKYIK